MRSVKTLAERWLAGFALFTGIALMLVLLWPSPSMPALACAGTDDGHVMTTDDFSMIPSPVFNDAMNIATICYPDDSAKADELLSQLAGIYLDAVDKDFVVIFNPGGWGWDPVSEIPGWESILKGIDCTLADFGYDTLLVDYKRTRHGFNGIIGEIEGLLGVRPAKTQELAFRINFLTEHVPDLRVIITGESNGASFADDVLFLLKDNPRVYAIESGPPVWHACLDLGRSLIICNNGVQDDTFSNGDIILILRSNLESAFGIYEGGRGDILLYIGAPGHYYTWEYPAVREQVVGFLTEHFCVELN